MNFAPTATESIVADALDIVKTARPPGSTTGDRANEPLQRLDRGRADWDGDWRPLSERTENIIRNHDWQHGWDVATLLSFNSVSGTAWPWE